MSDEQGSGEVRSEVDGRVLKITIANAQQRNAVTPDMMHQLSDALTELDENPDLWAGVICAEGDHFTSGLDMAKFFAPGAEPKPIPVDKVDPLGLTKRCRKPVVTAVQGICYTVGVEIMLAGDIVVAADDVRFCQMEAKRGIAPLGGAHFRYLTRAGWGDAMYHLLLCDEFGASEAHRIGLVQEVVAPGEQVERAMELARTIAKNAPIGIQATKAAANSFIAEAEKAAIAAIPEIREKVMKSQDMMEGIASLMQRRPAEFKGQ
ncbi:crotonase/enoyl-CoA hydratase family protein [Alteriqipengyuania flavescens]|uniref:crotonase/enoyl-CoA hydratase family protein n=1 Tax=Alteriqipengyuania flavescens TaxID=3053610 RepID=UPI0025B2A780|nr:crotonase/enoyl-CoA hydratase family protein [Alteriqipengyuania flavescens]WJY19938.1 crotonase/enoyl-CoA hydratase family protein [Alteriqipengyuania flavescens]WJY25882.1 crotonase/enoyl-CoA hydratase family protein [Alteriqipengyuania flavescens]